MLVYVLCMTDYEYTEIYGIFTDKDKLKEAYDQLVKNDCRCSNVNRTILPEIYEFPLNQFVAWENDWDGDHKQYGDCCEQKKVSIEKLDI